MRVLAIAISVLTLGSTMTACTVTTHTPSASPAVASAPGPVWPAPPLAPRIRFVASVTGAHDLGIKASLWKRLRRFIAGEEETFFVRPTDVATRGEALYVADAGGSALWILDPPQQRIRRVTAAGKQQLVSPVAVAPGSGDRIYVADSYHRRVFVYDAKGQFLNYWADDEFKRPAGLAFDAAADRLYIADSAAHRVWVYTADGRRISSIGRRGAAQGEFNFPTHVAVGGGGKVYVTDALGFRIQMFTGDGQFIGAFGRHGNGSGDFSAPKGVASDSEGHVYVVDALFDAVQIFNGNGRLLLSFGEHGRQPGQFWLPGGLFIDPQDRIFIADAFNRRIQIFQYLGGTGH